MNDKAFHDKLAKLAVAHKVTFVPEGVTDLMEMRVDLFELPTSHVYLLCTAVAYELRTIWQAQGNKPSDELDQKLRMALDNFEHYDIAYAIMLLRIHLAIFQIKPKNVDAILSVDVGNYMDSYIEVQAAHPSKMRTY